MNYSLSPEERAKQMGRGFKRLEKMLDRVNYKCEYILALCNTLTGKDPEQVAAFLEAEKERVLALNQKTITKGFKQMGLRFEIVSNDGLNLEVELFSKEHGALHTQAPAEILTSGEVYKDWFTIIHHEYPHLFGEEA